MNFETRFWIGKCLLVGLFVGSLYASFLGLWVTALSLTVILLLMLGLSARLAPFWWPRKSKYLPHILMLHNVSNRVINPIAPNNTIRPMTLDCLISDLLASGYHFMTLSEAMAAPLKKRTIVLTFDDGCVDNYTNLFPLLKKHKVKATLYLSDLRGEIYLSDAQILEMVASGLVEVGGHTQTHCELHSCSAQEAIEEVQQNRLHLQQLTKQPVESFAYPGGFHPEQAYDAVKKAGFRYAVLTKRKVKGTRDNLRLPRTIVPRESTTIEAYCLATRGRKHV
jgi:peptidoglycan/xylan/chitin deacetylase (PgdA/CDA1 family)